jgi:hypothetical protein
MKRVFVFFVIFLCACTHRGREKRVVVIDESRLRKISVNEKINLLVLDTYEQSVKNILKELAQRKFLLYSAGCYSPRTSVGRNVPSLHAYAAALDINPRHNPYIDVLSLTIIPPPDKRCSVDISSEDFYVNRNYLRAGMITCAEAEIFARNGFTIWGGRWRRPIDYMHFQTTMAIAKIVAKLSSSEAAVFWKNYLRAPKLVAEDSFFTGNIKDEDIKLAPLLKRIDEIIQKQK